MMRRRELVGRGAALAGLAMASRSAGALAQAPAGGFDWQRFRNTTIEVSLTANAHADLLQLCEDDFEALTGITVNSVQSDYQQRRREIAREFESGKTSFDVSTLTLHDQKVEAHRGKWFEDLRPYLADPKLTAADYDSSDFASNALEYVTQDGGRIDTLPLNVDYWILYWNKALFEARGIARPDDVDAVLAAAKALHDPKGGVYGWVSRGLKNANVPVWINFQLGFDQVPMAPDGTLQTTTPEAIAAATIYRTLTHDFAPPGIAGFDRGDCLKSFASGKVAMWIDGIDNARSLEDPTASEVVGKVGYSLVPRGPRARSALLYANGIGVSRFSANKQAAYLYCQWATGKAMQLRALLSGSAVPARRSALADPAAETELAYRGDWLETAKRTAAIARPGMPQIPGVLEFRDIFGMALANVTGGAPPEHELALATATFQRFASR